MNASFLRIPTLLAGLLAASSALAGGVTALGDIPARFAGGSTGAVALDVTPRISEVLWSNIPFIHGLDGSSAPARSNLAQCPALDTWRGEAPIASLSTPLQFDAGSYSGVQLASGEACPVGSHS